MTPDSVGPLTRPVDVARLPGGGDDVTVTADAEERAALAADFDLPAIHSLVGRFRVSGSLRWVKVKGRVEASIRQTCVVSLEQFDSEVAEEVEVEFVEPEAGLNESDRNAAIDRPDVIVEGSIDLGALTAEFLALGLDPHPRKPDTAFSAGVEAESDKPLSAFAALSVLKRPG